MSYQSGSRSKGICVLNDSSAESDRLWVCANMRPRIAFTRRRTSSHVALRLATKRPSGVSCDGERELVKPIAPAQRPIDLRRIDASSFVSPVAMGRCILLRVNSSA